jgi:superfamily II DNA or RNA helicase/HKD family nuclease
MAAKREDIGLRMGCRRHTNCGKVIRDMINMSSLLNELTESLRTGFVDHDHPSRVEFLPQFLSNNKDNGKKVLATIHQELGGCDEFWFSVAFVTKSGVMTIVNLLKALEKKGIRGKMLVSQYQNFTEPEALKLLLKFSNLTLKILNEGDFHAKGYLFKRQNLYNLIIGSSNLTAKALCVNKEWNLKVSATEKSNIIKAAIREFQSEFESAKLVDDRFIAYYQTIYNAQIRFYRQQKAKVEELNKVVIEPNRMQTYALASLKNLRNAQKNKALIISATGTGKTYLAAFDVKSVNPKRFLFVVHRTNIARKAMESFKKIFQDSRTMGVYSGDQREGEMDFVFSTIQTISRDNHLHQFDRKHFDYIVLDETHRAGATSYQKIVDYFKPQFLLGMTATPERTDGFDIFSQFDHNIAYEIRLHKALEEDMLAPFHYFGVTDISVGGKVLDETSDFSLLVADERVDKIIENVRFYGSDNGKVRGLIFCRGVQECKELSGKLNSRGFKTVALTGDDNEDERSAAITRLESDDDSIKLDYILTCDIFNEGVDIPKVNQVLMLRPTQSAIVFVQQMGRGLRKAVDKKYLTIIDFIGNYQNNYLVPIALYGDTTYNKDTLRKLMAGGSNFIPGACTINFDEIAKERIFRAIDNANFQLKKDLIADYDLLKFQLGRPPLMIDFVEHGSRDPKHYVEYSRSFYNFSAEIEHDLSRKLSKDEIKLMELFSNEIGNAKRIGEIVILEHLLNKETVQKNEIKKAIQEKYAVEINDETILSCIANINFDFVTERSGSSLITVQEKYKLDIVSFHGNSIRYTDTFKQTLKNAVFRKYFEDLLRYATVTYDKYFDSDKYMGGFILYQKYSRKDVFRILNWARNPVAQNVGGYIIDPKGTNCAIFVNYHKEDDISETTKYADRFINNMEFEWMSKSNRTLKSPDVMAIIHNKDLRLPLFVKKSNAESSDFYYLGDLTPIENSFEQTTMSEPGETGRYASVVKTRFLLNPPVEGMIYQYLTTPFE